MHIKKAVLAADGRSARGTGVRPGPHQPAPQHDPRGCLRDPRREGPRRAGRRLRDEGGHPVPVRVRRAWTTKTSPAGAPTSSKPSSPRRSPKTAKRSTPRSRRSCGPGPARSGKVQNGQFINFPLSLAIPADAAGKALEFRTVQTYSNGQVVHWIDPSLTAEHPSPRINVTAKGGVVQEVAGAEAGPEAGATGTGSPAPAPATTSTGQSTGGASKGLGIAALVVASWVCSPAPWRSWRCAGRR